MIKRLFDILVAIFGLVILSPVFCIIAFSIKKDSVGPIFYRQERVGLKTHPFMIYKFRTMCVDSERLGLQITIGEDHRITNVGSFLRRYKLDEIPQLIDVLRGKMSLVGPRPEVAKYVDFYSEHEKSIVFSVRPGITDNASLEFRNESSLLGESESPEFTYVNKILPIKIKHYISYVANQNFFGDLLLIIRTLRCIF